MVQIGHQRIYLGQHGSPESYREYDRVVGEWLATGAAGSAHKSSLTIAELSAYYWAYAQ